MDLGVGIPAEPLFRSAKEWNNSLKTKLSLLPKKLFRIRMSRNFGIKMLTMTNLSTECLIQLTNLGYDATPFNQILKQNAKREMRVRLGKVTVADVLAAQPVTNNLLKLMRAAIKKNDVSNLQRDRQRGNEDMPRTRESTEAVCGLKTKTRH